jgi:hypothetical protein
VNNTLEAPPAVKRVEGRLVAFRVLAAIVGLLFVVANVPVAISPWGPVTFAGGTEGIPDLDLVRWSAALAGGPDLGGGLLLVALAWLPMLAPVALQWLALAVVVFLATQIPFYGPVVGLLMVPFAVVLAVYPDRDSLLKRPWSEGVHLPILVLGSAVALALAPNATEALVAQISNSDALAERNVWASNAEHLVNLGLAAMLAGMRRPGGLLLTAMVGGSLVYLGAAAMSVPANPGSWGTVGGGIAVATGVALSGLAFYAWRH